MTSTRRPIKKLLIANRGEIAVRIANGCEAMGITPLGVYSEADASAYHVSAMRQAVLLGPAAPRASYLNAERVLDAARSLGADAIHPGYGFLSENAAFAQAVMHAGLVWVGPPPSAIAAMGSKTAARETMRQSGVPIVPGDQESVGVEALMASAKALGFPVLVKAAAGGGGKGMRVVRAERELREAVEGAQREAQNAFGDAEVYLEKYLDAAHHVEVQVLADAHGNVIHLGDRECSVQRRHQKVLEESPSPLLDGALRARMGEAAVAAARAVGYVNAGTVEFLVDEATRAFYFLEMNTRLQVEHPVTELVTGIDLVEAQLRIAMGEPLPWQQSDVRQRGHAIEARVYAEDPAAGHLPSTGTVLLHAAPTGPGVRVDAGVETGSEVSHHYDPMLAKLVVWGEDRPAALRRLDLALSRYAILGVTTNLAFLRDVARHEVFSSGRASTRWLESAFAEWPRRIEGKLVDPCTGEAAPLPSDVLPDELFAIAALGERAVRAQSASSPGVGPRAPTHADPWNVRDRFLPGVRS